MATKKALTQPTTTPTVPTGGPEKGTKPLDLGTPIPVDRSTMPKPGKRGGRASNEPEMRRWLAALQPGTTFQLGGGDEDGAHTVNRITQFRTITRKFSEETGQDFTVETSPVETGKRYLVYVTPGVPQEAAS